MKLLVAAAAMLIAAAPLAAQDVALSSEIFVERTVTDAAGKTMTTLEAPKVVTPGDPLVFRLRYANTTGKPVENFRMTNPLPDAVTFVGTSSADAEYSVDGGKAWGRLAQLTVKSADGTIRPAAPADVTHVQFTLKQPIPVGGKGEVSFKGVVK